MKYDLFIADFDKTLGSSPADIDEETASAVREYIAMGGKFVICTGRCIPSVRDICRRYGFSGLAVCYQGACIVDVSTGEKLFVDGIDNADAVKVIEDLKDEDARLAVDIGDIRAVKEDDEIFDIWGEKMSICGRAVGDLSSYVKKTGLPVYKICTYLDTPEIADKIKDKYVKKYKGFLEVNKAVPLTIEFVNPKFTKKQAVEWLIKYYNVPPEKTLAVGDSLNDMGFLQNKWHGVIVGDGYEEVKKYADEITVPFKDKPVKYLLNKYCLQEKK